MAQAMNHNVDPTFRTILSRYDADSDNCDILSIVVTDPNWYSVDFEGSFGYATRKKLERAGYELINVYSPEYMIEDTTRVQFKKR